MKRQLYALALLVASSSLGADCFKASSSSPSDNTTPQHQTKIIGAIVGDYANSEVVTFSIDGVVIGDATGSGTVSKIVTPNENHLIEGTSKGVPLTLSAIVNLQPGEVNTFNFPCKPATITVTTDAALALLGITQINISSSSGLLPAPLGSLVPGEQGVFHVQPTVGTTAFIATDQTGKLITSTGVKLVWDSRFSWTVTK